MQEASCPHYKDGGRRAIFACANAVSIEKALEMKLVRCPECRKAVIARGVACAECGLNLSGSRRGLLTKIIWSLALVLTVQGSIVLLTRFH